MQYALLDSKRVQALPSTNGAICPSCSEKVIPKCGEIKVWHWSHTAVKDCDPWYEHETEWHRDWKNFFPESNREITIGCHRADIYTNTGWVIELQNSSISTDEIVERECFYGPQMIWIINGTEFDENFDLRYRDNFITFRWKHPRLSWAWSRRHIYIDFPSLRGDGDLFLVRKLYNKIPCGGWGEEVSTWDLVHAFIR